LYKGNVAAVARACERSRPAVYNFINDHPELAEELKVARETIKDDVESRFYLDCLKDEPQYQSSRIFFLKTQCKDRGYVERVEQTGKDGGPIASTSTIDVSKLTDEQLATLARLLELAGGPPPDFRSTPAIGVGEGGASPASAE